MKDPIVEEIHRIRAEISAAHGDDLHRIIEHARRRQGANGRRVVSFDPADGNRQPGVLREDPPIG
jgi:hypothetical protein